MTNLLWYSASLHSCEAFVADDESSPRLRGAVVTPLDDRPAHIHYEVTADSDWATRTADVVVDEMGSRHHLRIEADGQGHWALDGQSRSDLDGCLDVDLGFTPATNTLSIRRLGLDLDLSEERDLDVAWLLFPELRLQRATQTYRRLDDRTWLYRSGSFSARLAVDDAGYVLRYGDDDLWVATAVNP